MWDIIDYSNEYFDEMIEMTTEYYGKENDISNGNYIKHEYFNNPAGDAIIKFAYDFENARMAGQYIVLPRDYMVNGNIYKSVLSLNTLTREDYRGQQIFTKVAEAVYGTCKDSGVSFCYGAPNPNSFPGFMKKLSFVNMGEMPLFLKIRNPFRLVFDKLCIPYKHTDMLIIPENLKKESVEIVNITEENLNLFDVFWEKISHKYTVMGVRNSKYIKWRYIDLPRRDYVILMAMQKGEPCGFIIGRITEVAGMRCGMIVDMLFDRDNWTTGQILVDSVMSCFKKSKIGLIGCLMQRHVEEAELLCKNGFFMCPKPLLPQPFPIIFRQFNKQNNADDDVIENFDNWFFTMGDYDVI